MDIMLVLAQSFMQQVDQILLAGFPSPSLDELGEGKPRARGGSGPLGGACGSEERQVVRGRLWR